MAVAAASFKIVIVSIRFTSKSYIFCTSTSKPSKINTGKLGLFSKVVRWVLFCCSTSNPLACPIEVSPRILNSGKALGSDPHSLLSLIRKEGSNVCNAAITFFEFTFINCSFVTVVALPVKLSLRILEYPVTTTSSIFF